MSATALRELFASFGIEVLGGEQLDQADKKLDNLFANIKQVAKFSAEVFAAQKFGQFIEGQIAAGAALQVTAQRLGTTTDELQAFDLAAGEANVSAEAMNTALRFLNRNIGEAIAGNGEATKAFGSLGIQFKNLDGTSRTAGDVIGELADKIAATKDPAKATNLAMQLLGRGGAELVPILLKGGDAFRQAREEMQALGGGMSKEFVQQAHEAQAANVRLSFALTGLKSTIAFATLPYVEKLVGWLTKVVAVADDFAKHTTVLTTGLDALALVASIKLGAALVKLTSSFLEMDEAFAGALLWGAAIAAAYLLFDDFWTMMKGGKSIIGDDIDAIFGFGAAKVAVDYITAAFEDATDVAKSFGVAVLDTINLILSPLAAAYHYVGGIGQALGDVARAFGGKEHGDPVEDVNDGYNAAGDYIKNAWSRTAKSAADLFGGPSAIAKLRDMRARDDAEFGPDIGPGDVEVGQIDFTGSGFEKHQRRSRPAHDFTFVHAPVPHVRSVYDSSSPRYATAPAAVGGGEAPAAAPIINQNNPTNVNVYTSSDKPDDVGRAVGQGVSSTQQRNNNNALASVKRP